jgi:hypothetical protein
MQRPLIQFDCWGRTKLLAAAAAVAVQTAARKLYDGPPQTVGQTVLLTGEATQKRWWPDPVNNTPRYAVDLLLAIHGQEA